MAPYNWKIAILQTLTRLLTDVNEFAPSLLNAKKTDKFYFMRFFVWCIVEKNLIIFFLN